VFPEASFAVTVTEPAVPAVTDAGNPETVRSEAEGELTVNELLVPVAEPSVATIVVEPVAVDVTVSVFAPLENAPICCVPVHDEEVKAGFPV
jgi:hypothetical protein